MTLMYPQVGGVAFLELSRSLACDVDLFPFRFDRPGSPLWIVRSIDQENADTRRGNPEVEPDYSLIGSGFFRRGPVEYQRR